MKRLIVCGLFLLVGIASLQAKDPWAELEEAVAVREGRPLQQRVINNTNSTSKIVPLSKAEKKLHTSGQVTVLPAIVAGRTLKVSVYPPSPYDERYENAKKLILSAYNDWFKNAVDWIKYEHREKEFADVLPILRRGVHIEFVDFLDVKGADVWISIDDTLEEMQEVCDCWDCLGCESSASEDIPMSVHLFAGGVYSTVVHELGHTLGLADVYETGYQKNASRTHRSARQVSLTVMEAGDNELSGDDADGLINMIDSWTIYLKKKQYPGNWQEHISSRILKGWNSLLRYKTGSSVDRYRMGTSQRVLRQTQREKAFQMVSKKVPKIATWKIFNPGSKNVSRAPAKNPPKTTATKNVNPAARTSSKK